MARGESIFFSYYIGEMEAVVGVDIVYIPANSGIGLPALHRGNIQMLGEKFTVFVERLAVLIVSDNDERRKCMVFRTLVDDPVFYLGSLIQKMVFSLGRKEMVDEFQLIGCKYPERLVGAVFQKKIHQRIPIKSMRLDYTPRSSFLSVVFGSQTISEGLYLLVDIVFGFRTFSDIVYARNGIRISVHVYFNDDVVGQKYRNTDKEKGKWPNIGEVELEFRHGKKG